jgi:hypothetical protein
MNKKILPNGKRTHPFCFWLHLLVYVFCLGPTVEVYTFEFGFRPRRSVPDSETDDGRRQGTL